MSQRKQIKSHNFILSLFRRIRILCQRMTRNLTRSLLRSLMLINRQDRYSRAGFVLPTVTMVLLVVVLLTIAISFRALERSQDARMVRVSQEALNAATPAVDRGRAKIEQMFKDLEGKVLDEPNFYQTLTSGNFTAYRFKDEEVLRVQFDSDPDNNGIQPNGSAPANDGRLGQDDDNFRDNERIRTAWRFPVDTNNDGKFDSFVLYGLFFRSPEGTKRSPLEARTLPMPPFKSATRPECEFARGQNASLVTASGWSPMEGKLKKSIFVYTTTVPATQTDIDNFVNNVKALGGNQFNAQQFKKYEGEPSFTALEYQQDWKQKYLTGVVYENDLDITPGPAFNLNGNLYTQGNLIVSHFGDGLNIYQISSINSCFYQQEKSKIVVGGNVINGMMGNNLAADILPVNVHLFNGTTTPTVRTIDTTEQSISNGAYAGAFNDFAYRSRLEALVQWQEKDATGTTDPTSVKEAVSRRMADDSSLVKSKVRREELQSYFKDRLRKVTFAEVSSVNNKDVALSPYGLPPSGTNPLQGSGDTLRPPDLWTSILTAMVTVTPSRLSATKPETQQASGVETVIGDRVLEGNNLPALKLDSTNKWVTATTTIANDQWTDTTARTRVSQLSKYPSAGDRSRDGFWEKLAAREPFSKFSNFGGLRVVTGAGVYERRNSFLPPPKWNDPSTPTIDESKYDDPATTATAEAFDIVWPDTMPMSPVLGVQIPFNNAATPAPGKWDSAVVSGSLPAVTPTIDPNTPQYLKGDLRMRATAVYHYAQDAFNPSTDPPDLTQKPIACVSSYYDPSDKTTAKNMNGLPDGVAGGRSNNGIVYPFPDNRPTSATLQNGWKFTAPTGLPTGLADQANMVFPDGRFANKPLRDALTKLAKSEKLTLADQSALDTTLCALSILNGATPQTIIPHNAIKEITLLNPREVKALDRDKLTTRVDETFSLSSPLSGNQRAQLSGLYNLPLEERQPLEIRVTQIDLNVLRNQTIPLAGGITGPSPEYLLPNSGIIYASREDALPDRSNRSANNTNNGIDENTSAELSPADFLLDPSRRPNGIMLINGNSLGRNNNQAATTVDDILKEKGLILASNVPVYIQGNFNTHTQAEFTGTFSWDINSFYSRNTLNPNFACRQGDPTRPDNFACGTGDNWRPATVLADAITILSDNFRFGFRNEGDFDLRNNAGNAIIGFDFNGDGDTIDAIPPASPITETAFGFDLNGNGDRVDTITRETQVSAKAARMLNGFDPYNNFATNGLSSGTISFTADEIKTGVPSANTTPDDAYYLATPNTDNNNLDNINSSYFNNLVTPVQRRGNFSEYLMEVCRKLPVSACGPDDWVLLSSTGATPKASTKIGQAFDNTINGAGTTGQPPNFAALQRLPRRIAFRRSPNPPFGLEAGAGSPPPPISSTNPPVALGINTSGNVVEATFADAASTPRTTQNNTLWFQTNNGGTDRSWGSNYRLWYFNPAYYSNPTATVANVVDTTFVANSLVRQPLLVPILQLNSTTTTPGGTTAVSTAATGDQAQKTRWMPRSSPIEANLVLTTSDVPARPAELNGGMQNLPRFIENWNEAIETNIAGSFLQKGRSEYASAPYLSLRDTAGVHLFGNNTLYNISSASGRIGYFVPPTRNWGFDVGLLYQLAPDYFTQNFTVLETNENGDAIPDEYFREVGRDDPWLKALLCAKDSNGADGKKVVSKGRPDCKGYE